MRLLFADVQVSGFISVMGSEEDQEHLKESLQLLMQELPEEP